MHNRRAILKGAAAAAALAPFNGAAARAPQAAQPETMYMCEGELQVAAGSNMWSWSTKWRA